tara:strand:- start:1 stop:150 length:150 start_codon:yes stop_codon:yes gene_type:complete
LPHQNYTNQRNIDKNTAILIAWRIFGRLMMGYGTINYTVLESITAEIKL